MRRASISRNSPECDAQGVRRLGRGIDNDLVEPVVAIGKHGAAFERRARLPLHAELAADRDFRRARRGFDVAAFDDALDVEVVAPVIVHQVAAAAHVARRVDDRVEHLEIDGDRVGEVFRLAARRGDAGGDRLADIAHLVGGERRPGAAPWPRLACNGDADRFDARQIGGGEDAAARLGRDRDRS